MGGITQTVLLIHHDQIELLIARGKQKSLQCRSIQIVLW